MATLATQPTALTVTGSATLTKPASDTVCTFQIYGTYTVTTFVFEGSADGTNFAAVAAVRQDTGATVTGTIAPADTSSVVYNVPATGLVAVRLRVTAIGSNTLNVLGSSYATVGQMALGTTGSGPGAAQSGVTFSGTNTFSTMPNMPASTVAATGSAIGNAAALTAGFVWVTAANATKGVQLPVASAGLWLIVKNDDTANAVLPVYPQVNANINALAANASLNMAAKTSAVYWAYNTTQWFSVPLLPS